METPPTLRTGSPIPASRLKGEGPTVLENEDNSLQVAWQASFQKMASRRRRGSEGGRPGGNFGFLILD